MRKIANLVMAALLILSLSSCYEPDPIEPEPKPVPQLVIGKESVWTVEEHEGFSLEAGKDITPSGGTFSLSVNTNLVTYDLFRGLSELEIFKDGVWKRIIFQDNANAIADEGRGPISNGNYSFEVNWSNRCGDLPPGRYRLLRFFKEETESGFRQFGVAAEFEITE